LEATADSNGIVADGRGNLSVTETEASLTVTNSTGVLHGIVISETGTTVVGNDYNVISGDSILSMTDSGLKVNADSNGYAADGAGNLSVTETEASLTVTNKDGETHGVTITGNETTISGGTTSTSMVLNNSGATFTNTATGGPVRVTGVADGESDYDAVNYSQLKSVEERAYQGIAAVSALAAIPPPIPGKKFSIGVGYGYYEDENAVAVGIKGNLFNRASVGTGVGYAFGGRATVNAGLSFSW
ncbi:MAG: YadA-like family protein, partial [Candidatus Scalindua sp.]